METDKPVTSKPKRRWHQYSLRTLMIFVTLFAFACSWFAVKMQQAKIQHKEVEELTKLGLLPFYDYNFDSTGKYINNAHPSTPVWLQNLLGVDFFNNVSQIQGAENTNITDMNLIHIEGLTKLKNIYLSDSKITSVGLSHFKGLLQLETLEIRYVNICDADLIYLKSLINLKKLVLGSPQITDVGLVHLEGLTQLEILEFWVCPITDEGLIHLKGMKKLKKLRLIGEQITDEGLKNIKGLTQIQLLDLRYTKVTDAGVKDLQKALPNLKIER
jgi:hypothetical protein